MKTIEVGNNETITVKIDKSIYKLTKEEGQKLFNELWKEYGFPVQTYPQIIYVNRYITTPLYPQIIPNTPYFPTCQMLGNTNSGNLCGTQTFGTLNQLT